MTTRIRRARRSDAAAIGRVHVETWQSAYAGLLPDSLLVSMSDVRQSAWWSRALADPVQAPGIFVADDDERGVVGFTSGGPARDTPERLDGAEVRVGEVYTLYVEPDFQDQGLGRGLLDALFGKLLADNPTRFFYEALGGEPVGERTDTLGGEDVEEVAYAWRDLEAPLERRSRVAEE